MQAKQVRQKFLDFMQKKGHKIIPSASLLPENDPTTLFTGSGMQPMVPYLLGEKYPGGETRIANSQKCFRAKDIEEVGDNRHTTFFEMLGNWSLGDYFKKEQIKWIFEFLTQELKLDSQRLYVSVYRGNEKLGLSKEKEAVEIWKKQFNVALQSQTDTDLMQTNAEVKTVDLVELQKQGVKLKGKCLVDMDKNNKIFYYGDSENWWSRAGIPNKMPVGEPGGPDSEIFWDFGANLKLHENSKWKDQPCHPNCKCGRFMEIGNNVFMQYQKTEKGFQELKQRNIDFGGGLERLTAAVKDISDIFLIDLFDQAIKKLEEISGKKYNENEEVKKSFRVILDHLRASTFLINDGANPSNKDAGYFTRRLIRRAVRLGHQLGIKENFTAEISQAFTETYQDYYVDLKRNQERILKVLEGEENKFRKTLKKGLKRFKIYDLRFKKQQNVKSKMQINSKSLILNSQQTQNSKLKADTLEPSADEPKDIFVSGKDIFDLYQTYGFPIEMSFEELERMGVKINKDKLQKEFEKELQKHKNLSRTASAGKFKGGLADNDEKTTQLHTITHLMLAGLRKVLGEGVIQRGSNITPERIRFDFSYNQAMTEEQKKAVEDFVNQALQKGGQVELTEMSKQQAMGEGVTGAFWEKYPEQVKVYTIIAPDGTIYSRELCGGPHIKNLSEIKGKFKIIKEKSSGAGVRRIKAIVE